MFFPSGDSFCRVGNLSTATPDFYVRTHTARYYLAIIIGTVATAYTLWLAITYAYLAVLIMLRGNIALTIKENVLSSHQTRSFSLKTGEIQQVEFKPYQRALGRPQRLRIIMKDGATRNMRCDILDQDGPALARVISLAAGHADRLSEHDPSR